MIPIDYDPALAADMARLLSEARQLLSICTDEAEAKEISPTVITIDALLDRARKQHLI